MVAVQDHISGFMPDTEAMCEDPIRSLDGFGSLINLRGNLGQSVWLLKEKFVKALVSKGMAMSGPVCVGL